MRRDHAGDRRHRRASVRRADRDDDRDTLSPGKYTLTESLAPIASRAVHRRAPGPLVDERTARRHGFVAFDPIGVGSLGDDLDSQSDEAAELYQRARAAFEAGRFLEAGQLFEQAAVANPANREDAICHAALSYRRALLGDGDSTVEVPSGDHEATVQSLRTALSGSQPEGPQPSNEQAPPRERPAPAAARAPEANVLGRGEVGATGSGGGASEQAPSESSDRERTDPGGEVGNIQVRTAAPAPGGGGQERTTVGVGEHVTFTAQRSGTWTASAGQPTTGSGSTFRWVAPSQPGAITISFSGGRAARSQGNQQQGNQQQSNQQQSNQQSTNQQAGNSRQQGSQQQGSQQDGNASVSMNVIAPTSLSFTKAAELDSQYTGAGVGMELRYRIGPSNVSWGAIEVKEVRTGSAANAVGVQGYFAERFTPAQLRHEATEAWENIEDNSEPAQGRGDTAAIAPGAHLPEPWTNGQYGWVIPWSYRTQGDRSGEGQPFTTVVQNFRIEGPTGAMTVTKGEASHRRVPPPGTMSPAAEQPRGSTEEPVRDLDFGAVPAPER